MMTWTKHMRPCLIGSLKKQPKDAVVAGPPVSAVFWLHLWASNQNVTACVFAFTTIFLSFPFKRKGAMRLE